MYWFEPGSEPQQIFYDNGTKQIGVYTNVEWFDNCLAVRITPPTAPFLLLKSKVFISYQGAPSDSSYNYKESFYITINKDSSGIPGKPLTPLILAQAKSDSTLGKPGEWVEIEHNLLMLEQKDFWILFHWKEGSPLSPLVGVDSLPNCGRSYWGWKKNGYWEWTHLQTYNLMIGAVIVANNTIPLGLDLKVYSQPSTSADSFRIYRAEKPGGLGSSDNRLVRLNPSDFNYIDASVENGKTYYYKISAWYGTQESDTSNQVWATPQKEGELWENNGSVLVALRPDEKKVVNLILKNIGSIPIKFQTKINMFLDSSSGGTDDFGYVWTDSDKKSDLDFSWIDIQGRDSVISKNEDNDTVYGPIHLGFSFPFYEGMFDSLFINTNGWISFTNPRIDFINKPLPSSTGPFNLIALFWDDLIIRDGSEIKVFSSSDSFVVSFEKLEHWIFLGSYSFQGILTKDGKISLRYKEMGDNTHSSTIGMQNEDASLFLPIVYNQNYVHDSLRIDIIPSWIEVAPRVDSILANDSLVLSLIFDSKLLNTGIYRADLIIEGEDKNHSLSPINIPVVLTVDTLTGVGEGEKQEVIETFSLSQNYPNPFNPATTIPFTVHGKRKTENSPVRTTQSLVNSSELIVNSPLHTTLTIYNVLGQRVKTLVDGEKLLGEYEVIWDGKDEAGKDVASGIYFYRLKVRGYIETKRMLLLK